MSSSNSKSRILDVTLDLIAKRGGADITMGEIAKAADLSRQALYLHFADRTQLLVAAVQHYDDNRDLPKHLERINNAPNALVAIRELAAMEARMNPELWATARAFEAVRRSDEDAERSWQDRLTHRLEGCRAIVARLQAEGTLKKGMRPDTAADILWTMTSLRCWEDLVLIRGWTAQQYEERLTELLLIALTTSQPSQPGLVSKAEKKRGPG